MIQPVITFHGGGHGVRNRFSGTRKNPRVANDFSPPPGNYRAPHFRRNFRVTPWKSYSHSSGSRVHLWNLQLLDRNDMPATSFQKNKHRNKSCRSNYFKLRNTFKRYRIEWLDIFVKLFPNIVKSISAHKSWKTRSEQTSFHESLSRADSSRAKRSSREEASFQGVEVHLAYSRIHLFSPWHAAIAFMGAVKQVEGVRIEPRFEFLDQPLFMPFSPIFNPLR